MIFCSNTLWGLHSISSSSASLSIPISESMSDQASPVSEKPSEVDVAMASAINEVMVDSIRSEQNSSSDDSYASEDNVHLANLRNSNPHPDDGVLVTGPPGSLPNIVAELFSEVEGTTFVLPPDFQMVVDAPVTPLSPFSPGTGRRFRRSQAAKTLV